MLRRSVILQFIVVLSASVGLCNTPGAAGIRLSNGLKIISVKPTPKGTTVPKALATASSVAAHPQPPLAGFSPLVAITTSDRKGTDDFDWEHSLRSSYAGNPLNAPAEENFVIGVFDTGSVVDLVAGPAAAKVGLTGKYLTDVDFPIGGVGGTISATISQPVGIFAAGLQAVEASGRLDLSQLAGHTNVSAVVAPPIICNNGESITAVVGTPMLAFYTTHIRVDRPQTAAINDQIYVSPEVTIGVSEDSFADYPRSIPIELGGLSPMSTSAYYAFPDMDDILGDWNLILPTLLSMGSMSIPMGGAFFTEMGALHGEPGPMNTVQTMRVMLDTGAQSSIMSSNIAARLNLPREPDFVAQACGIGGLVEVPGYYIDYVRINALGGVLEFSHVPFVVLDMESPEGGALDGILGMNVFWNRNIALEPTVGGAGFLHVSEPVPYAYIDLNYDDVVDVADFAIFASAWHSTADDPAYNVRCDFYLDDVIDLRDLEAFVEAWGNHLGPQ